MSESIARFYREVEAKVARLTEHRVENIATISYDGRNWPMFAVSSQSLDASRPTVLISAGVHGDEPAGVHAALTFLLDGYGEFQQALQFVVFPCVNPNGFDADTLETRGGANLNRLFGIESSQPEVRAIEDWLRVHQIHFRMTFDLHEARPDYVGEGFTEKDNPRAAYLYETVADDSERVGRAMIEALPKGLAVCDWPTIYDDVNENGVISYPEGCRNAIYAQGTSLDGFLVSRYTGHSFTLETPTGWHICDRIETHLTFMKTALRRSVLQPASTR